VPGLSRPARRIRGNSMSIAAQCRRFSNICADWRWNQRFNIHRESQRSARTSPWQAVQNNGRPAFTRAYDCFAPTMACHHCVPSTALLLVKKRSVPECRVYVTVAIPTEKWL